MKQLYYLLAISFLFTSANSVRAQNMEFSPKQIQPSESVKIKYDPKDGPLENVEGIEIIGYTYNGKQLSAFDVALEQIDGHYIGQVYTNDNTTAVFFAVKSEDGKITDGNTDKGYKILCTNAAGEPTPGAFASKAMMYSSFYRNVGIDKNQEKAFNLMKREFETYPNSKTNGTFFNNYAYLCKQLNNDAELAGLQEWAIEQLNKKDTPENLLMAIHSASTNYFKNDELASSVKETILERYPNGNFAQNEMSGTFRSKSLDEQVAFVNEYKKQFAMSEHLESNLNSFYATIASKYAKEKDWVNFENYLDKITDPSRKAGSLNGVAWPLSGESIDAEAPEANIGLAYSKKSLELLESAMSNPDKFKPETLSKKQWNKNLKSMYGMFADTYALLAYHQSDFKTALEYQQVACDQNNFHDGEMNERYCVYYEKENGLEKTEKLLSKFIAEGNANSKMKEMHKTLFLQNNSIESAYDKYLVQLEKEALQKLKEEIKEKMIEKDAPNFDLVNLKGERVTSESLLGKVVVVDFWATWCGPCKASFPGMQKAVNKYEKSDDVVFVFIDTWERGEQKEQNAAKFINDNNYTFNVLMDNEDVAVTAFGVGGIPTKFILDKQGKIRFESVGFGGNDDELVKELELMIEMAGGHTSKDLTGAP